MATENQIECTIIDNREVAGERANEGTRLQYIANIVREWEEVVYLETTEALQAYVQRLLEKS